MFYSKLFSGILFLTLFKTIPILHAQEYSSIETLNFIRLPSHDNIYHENLTNNLISYQPANYDSLYSTKTKKKYSLEKTLILSIIPGSVIHGLGHFYLNENATGGYLFMAEMGGVSLVVASAFVYDYNEFYALWVIGGTLFIGTWIYDIYGAVKICNRINRIYEKASIHPYFTKNKFGNNQIGLRLSYWF